MTERPPRPRPGEVPPADLPPATADALFERRVVLLQGFLGYGEATQVAAQLMALDALGDAGIRLQLHSDSGTLQGALTVMDTISSLGVPVETVCLGSAQGPALGVLAVSRRRLAARHARLRFRPSDLAAEGTSAELTAAVEWHLRQEARWVELVAGATSQPAERVEVDLAQARYLELEEAIEYRLLDGILPSPP